MCFDDLPDFVTAEDLASLGVEPEDLPRLTTGAVRYAALDGEPCWAHDDLADRLHHLTALEPTP